MKTSQITKETLRLPYLFLALLVGLLSLFLRDGLFRKPSREPSSATASTPASIPATPMVWHIHGQSESNGPYEGELRMGSIRADGTRSIVREVQFKTLKSGSLGVSEIWEGVAKNSKAEAVLELSFNLKQASFIANVTGFSLDPKKLGYLNFSIPVQDAFSNSNLTWIEVGETDVLSAGEPLASEPELLKKVEMRVASKPVFGIGTLVHLLAGRYFSDPFVSSFKDNKAYQEAIQYTLYDYTNFDFYKKKPQTIRIVNQIINPASLTEEALRYQAYAPTLAEKAKYYDDQVRARDLDQFGLISFPVFDPTGAVVDHQADYDSALWTGQYIASQYFRYQVTGESEALENIKKSASAMTILVEISADPKEFARTLLPVGKPPVTFKNGWLTGTGQFKDIQYNSLGNNDMIRGVILGLLLSYEALPESESALKREIQKSIKQLADQSRVVQSKDTHRLNANGAAYLITLEPRYKDQYESLAAEMDGRSFSEIHPSKDLGGVSDWSGNNLGITADILRTFIAHQMSSRSGSKDSSVAIQSSYMDWKDIQNYRYAPYVFFLRGENSPQAPIDSDKVADAIFNLHEFPGAKPIGEFAIDHSIDPDFVLSPYPAQPWKFLDSKRPESFGYQSLISYPFFQSAALCTHWAWRDSPFAFRAETPDTLGFTGADYLFAYWLARYYNVIGQND